MWNRIMLIICSVFVLIGPASAGDLTRAPDKDFNTLEAAGNKFPEGIWSDGTTMWVLDHYFDKIYAYNMRSKAPDPDKDFNLAAGNSYPAGIWSDGTTMRVLDSSDGKIYAYNMRFKAHVQDKDFELHISVYAQPRDIWLDGMTVWVVDDHFDKIYAYGGLAVASDQGDQAIQVETVR